MAEIKLRLSSGGDNVPPGQCCHTPEGAVIQGHGKMLDSLKDREIL